MIKFYQYFKSFKVLDIYTDGSHKNGIGSWAYVVSRRKKSISEDFGCLNKANSNFMEFQAAIEALSAIPKKSVVNLHSDSRILVDAMTLGKEPRANQEQILALKHLCELHKVTWKWVKAHNGNKLNERCDALCISARNRGISFLTNQTL
jgi:ribonuclease HI